MPVWVYRKLGLLLMQGAFELPFPVFGASVVAVVHCAKAVVSVAVDIVENVALATDGAAAAVSTEVTAAVVEYAVTSVADLAA